MALNSDLNRSRKTSEELEELLDSLEKLIDRTKVMYEQYFMGIQKLPPAQLQRDIERRVRELTQENIRNTGLRFRFTMLTQKFGSYNTYWKRTMRQIESGSYVRDVVRAGRRAAKAGEALSEELLVKLPKRMQDKIRRDRARMEELLVKQGKMQAADADAGADFGDSTEPGQAPEVAAPPSPPPGMNSRGVFTVDESDLDDFDDMFASMTGQSERPGPSPPPARPSPPPARPTAAVPPPPPARPRPTAASAPPRRPAAAAAPPPPGMTDRECRELYSRYLKARELVGQKNDGVTYEKLVGSLAKQAPAIMKQHAAKGVEFNVVIKGDKVVLKAKPQK